MASLNESQSATLLALIQSDPLYVAYPNENLANKAEFIAKDLMLTFSPDFWVWRTTTPISEIKDAVLFANYTPANPGIAIDVLSAQNITNWYLACQGKRDNLWMLLTEGGFAAQGLSTARANTRTSLQDCTSAIPSGNLGANKSGGWAAIQLIIQRKANKLEKLFATGTGTQPSPGNLIIEGSIIWQEIKDIMAPPQ